MDLRETRTPQTCKLSKQLGHNWSFVLIKKPMIGGVDVLNEHLIILLFSYLLLLTLIVLKYM